MKNISQIHDCYGCGLCATVCGKRIIEIKLNKNGFYEPRINDLDKCISCGLCSDVCAFSHEELALRKNEIFINSWAAWSDDKHVHQKCSSGGIGFEIAKQLIEKDYKLCGCRYNADKNYAEHYIAITFEEAIASIGSKYIQSYTVDGFKAINRKEKYLVTGTPCQIDSFRRYIKKFRVEDNFVLLDFYCHSIPSMWAWQKYTKMVEQLTGKITHASWRNKSTKWYEFGTSADSEGNEVEWHDSYNIQIKGINNFYNSRYSKGDIYFNLFLGDYCCNPACVKDCKYKYDSSSADIRIGDLWGNIYKDNREGVSALITFTKKGKEIVEQLKGVTLVKHPFEIVAEGQMKRNTHKAPTYPIVMFFLKSECGLDSKVWKMLNFINRVCDKIKRMKN